MPGKKSAWLYLLPLSREQRVVQRLSLFLSQQYEYQTLQKASGKQGIFGELWGKQASADGEAGETLCRGSQKDPTNYLLAAALTIAL